MNLEGGPPGLTTAADGPSPRALHARRLFARIAPSYDLMARLLSFGQDGRWRRFLVSRVPADAGLVLDVATGTGAVAIQLSRRTRARIVGLDQSPEMLRGARRAVADTGLESRMALVQGTADRLPFADGSFDAVTFTYLLRYVDDPAATLCELARVVKPGGVLAMLEFLVPPNAAARLAWTAYTRIGLPLGGLLAGRAWYRTGRFLGPSISEFHRRYPLVRIGGLWRDAGLVDVRHRAMSLGGGVVMWGRRRGVPGRTGIAGQPVHLRSELR